MDLTIGELSRRSGVKVPTIRYYERIGLLPSPPRTTGQQRRYEASHMARLSFVRHARDLGFDLEAIRELLALSAEPERSCGEVDAIARRHLGEVERRIAHLTTLRAELGRMINECGHGRVARCRVIEVLNEADHRREGVAAEQAWPDR